MKRFEVRNYPSLKDARIRSKAKIETIDGSIEVTPSLKEWAKGKTYFIRTHGCQANVRDSENIEGILTEIGLAPALAMDEANVIIINTCAIRENAEDKVFGEIGSLKKVADEERIIAICGCMTQEEFVCKYIMEKMRQVKLIFGTHNIYKLANYLDEIVRSGKGIIDVTSKEGEIIENLPSTRNDAYKAFVNIMFGCDKFCTYCIVPYTRGKQRSRSIEDILTEVKGLIANGYKEVTLIGQNVNAYGKDREDGATFAKLLDEVSNLNIPRVRFTTSHPWDFADEMFEVMSKHKNIMPSLHLPVQSGNNEVLKRMGRRYTRETYLALVKRLRELIPNIAITTDIIVAFPNETEEEFLDTLTLVEEVKYDGAYTFIFSPRVGTPAYLMKDNLDDKTKHDRFNRLKALIDRQAEESSSKYVGKTLKILVDGYSKKDDQMLTGYSEESKVVHFKGEESLIGKIVDVKILESHVYFLVGEKIDG